MKKTTVKSLFLIGLAASLAAAFYACSEQKLAPGASASDTSPTPVAAADNKSAAELAQLNRSVGGFIDGDLGRKWIANYARLNKGEMTYVIQPSDLRELLSNSECIGISLCYAAADDGRLHILPIGVNAAGKVIAVTQIATVNGPIKSATAMKWISNYSGPVKSHFFGTDIYHTLIDTRKYSVIKISFALNDNSEPQLLLSDNSSSTASDFADISFPCPPYGVPCPTPCWPDCE